MKRGARHTKEERNGMTEVQKQMTQQTHHDKSKYIRKEKHKKNG